VVSTVVHVSVGGSSAVFATRYRSMDFPTRAAARVGAASFACTINSKHSRNPELEIGRHGGFLGCNEVTCGVRIGGSCAKYVVGVDSSAIVKRNKITFSAAKVTASVVLSAPSWKNGPS
jgi:hypothetical protein